MKTYADQILGPVPGSEDHDLFSAQMFAALGKQHHKKKGGKKSKKKLKKMDKQLQFLTQEYQRLKGLEKKLQKCKKKKKGLKKKLRAQELQCQQRVPWWCDAVTTTLSKFLDLAITSKSKQPLKSQDLLALPAPRNSK